MIELFEQEGYTPQIPLPADDDNVEFDSDTRLGAGRPFVTDSMFFSALGVTDLVSMDVSTYEGADIIHDLNDPVSSHLYESFDFIVDGGTFDHLIDVRMAFENVVKMLKPDGRVFQWNAASNYDGAAYLSFGPDLFYDYYTINGFSDCKVYVAELDAVGQREDWEFYAFDGTAPYGHFQSSRIQNVIVLAEKAPGATCDKLPVQAQYRDENLWEPYRAASHIVAASSRQLLTANGMILTKPEEERVDVGTRLGWIAIACKRWGPFMTIRRAMMRACRMLASVLSRCGTPSGGHGDQATGHVAGFRYIGKI